MHNAVGDAFPPITLVRFALRLTEILDLRPTVSTSGQGGLLGKSVGGPLVGLADGLVRF